MIVYQTSPATGEYRGPLALTDADLSPLEPGTFLIPGGCVETPPPKAKTGYARVWTGEAWTQIEDHRGEIVYLDGRTVKISSLGPVPDGASPISPEPPAPGVADVKSEAARRLAPTDWMVTRQAEGGKAIPDGIAAYRAAVRAASDRIEALDPIPENYADDHRWPSLPVPPSTSS